MKKTSSSILSGIVAIFVTIILYFIILGDTLAEVICFITLVGVVLAEIIVTAVAYLAKGDPRKVAATIAASLMVPIALILSAVYILNFPDGYGTYAGLYFAALAIILLVCALLWKVADTRKDDNDALQTAKANMLGMRKLVKSVMLKENAAKFKKELDELEDKLHFSNDAVITAMDANIRQMIMDLESNIDNQQFDAAAHIKAISNEIDRRNIFAKNTI